MTTLVYINKYTGTWLFLSLLDNSEDFLLPSSKKEMSSKSPLLVAKGVLFCNVNEYILLKPWKLRNDMISSYIKAIIIAIQQKEFEKLHSCVFVHSFCSLGMHVAINMIKEIHLFEGQKSL